MAQRPQKKGRRPLHIQRKYKWIFIAALSFISAMAGIMFGIIVGDVMNPPDAPAYVDDDIAEDPADAVDDTTAVADDSDESDDHSQAAYILPHGDVDDASIGDGNPAPEGFAEDDRKKDFYTVLIVGTDKGYNTDTIMIASYDGANKRANLISVPRDSKVNVKRDVKKINAAYGAGTLYGGGKEGGIAQLQREIKTIVGFVPDFYVRVDLGAFVQIVDTVDGVDVNVPYNMRYDDPDQNLHIDIPKGEQTLDGRQALLFARYRNGNAGYRTITDYERMENQQAVIKAVMAKVLRPINLLRIPEFIGIFTRNVDTDMKLSNLAWFGQQINSLRGTDALQMHTLPTSGTSGMPMYYEYLDAEGIVALVNDTVNPYRKDIDIGDLDVAR